MILINIYSIWVLCIVTINIISNYSGVIDMDYRGNVGVVVFNHLDKDFEVAHGDRIAQVYNFLYFFINFSFSEDYIFLSYL